MGRLLVISSAPAEAVGDRLRLDVKFVEGMRFYAEGWEGAVDCLVPARAGGMPFAAEFDPAALPFGLRLLAPGERPGAEELARYDVVLCSGDNHAYLDLAGVCARLGVRLYYIIEYILETRLQIIFLDPKPRLHRKLRGALWTLAQERRRRRAFRLAAGLQANGYPAAAAYRRFNSETLLYLDNRIGADLLVTDAEMAARRAHLGTGGRLRLIHSGRLEPMKGAQDLVPVAAGLKRAGVDFELNIFGTGSLEGAIREGLRREGLEDRVTLHGVVDFETRLVPFARAHADVFLSCHRQSDPSCSYLENMGCGLAVAGYANRMWSALCERSGGGWAVPLGDTGALSRRIAGFAAMPEEVIGRCDAARDFARAHLFEAEFRRRLDQLAGAGAR